MANVFWEKGDDADAKSWYNKPILQTEKRCDMTYGVIGTGWIAEAFIEGTRLLPGFTCEAVYSRTRESGEAFARKNQIPEAVTSVEELCRLPVDAAYVASPNVCHYQQCKTLLLHGKHVLCEKPLTVTLAQAQELYALAEERGLIFLEAIMMMHLPARRAVEEALPSLGAVRYAKFDFSQLSSKYPALMRGELPNIFNPKLCTGALMDLGVYCVYPAVCWFGAPDATMSAAQFLPTGADALGSAILSYPAMQCVLTYSKIGQSFGVSEIQGDLGTMSFGSISRLADITIRYHDGRVLRLSGDESKAQLMSYEAQDFARLVSAPERYRQEYAYDRDMSLKALSLLIQIRRQSGIHFEQ